MDTLAWKIFAIFSFVAGFVALIIGVVAMDKANIAMQANNAYSNPQHGGDYPSSCRGYGTNKKTGIYYVRPKSSLFNFPVYCDMESAGGGWTLVASVHENNIDGKCTVGDKWSSEQGLSSLDVGSSNWENLNIFGSLDTVTKEDYKNQAYFAVNGSDLMLWHVPNERMINQFSSSAYLKYYTNSGFLQKHGGNLRSLFKDHYPLKKQVGGLKPLIDQINVSSSDISRQVSNFHAYKYDTSINSNQITDGGKDMYDGGNRIYFRINGLNYTRMVYNAPYFLYANGVEIKTGTLHPFVSFAWVGSGLGDAKTNVQFFEYKVYSNFGADGKGNVSTYQNKQITAGKLTAMYTAFNVFNARDPSVCEVYFYIGSTTGNWKSKLPTAIQRIKWANTTKVATNVVRFAGNPRNVLIGYVLLSKTLGKLVSISEVENVIKQYMNIAATFQFKVTVPHHITPIKYIKGNNATIRAGIPTSQVSMVKPGFVQFRAFNNVGLPNALCPGVSVSSNNPEQICFGGVNSDTRSTSSCGDYAGWGGKPGTRRLQNSPTSTSRSVRDIESSILIFTR